MTAEPRCSGSGPCAGPVPGPSSVMQYDEKLILKYISLLFIKIFVKFGVGVVAPLWTVLNVPNLAQDFKKKKE